MIKFIPRDMSKSKLVFNEDEFYSKLDEFNSRSFDNKFRLNKSKSETDCEIYDVLNDLDYYKMSNWDKFDNDSRNEMHRKYDTMNNDVLESFTSHFHPNPYKKSKAEYYNQIIQDKKNGPVYSYHYDPSLQNKSGAQIRREILRTPEKKEKELMDSTAIWIK